jgi:hypothetical protein
MPAVLGFEVDHRDGLGGRRVDVPDPGADRARDASALGGARRRHPDALAPRERVVLARAQQHVVERGAELGGRELARVEGSHRGEQGAGLVGHRREALAPIGDGQRLDAMKYGVFETVEPANVTWNARWWPPNCRVHRPRVEGVPKSAT